MQISKNFCINSFSTTAAISLALTPSLVQAQVSGTIDVSLTLKKRVQLVVKKAPEWTSAASPSALNLRYSIR